MGSYERLHNVTDTVELEFGRRFRALHYEFYKTGELPKMSSYEGPDQWYYTDKSLNLEKKVIKAETCEMFDEMDLYLEV